MTNSLIADSGYLISDLKTCRIPAVELGNRHSEIGKLLERDPAERRHFLACPELQQAINRRLDEVQRIGAAVGLGEDVVDATGFENVANAGSCLDARARAGGDHDHLAGAITADH